MTNRTDDHQPSEVDQQITTAPPRKRDVFEAIVNFRSLGGRSTHADALVRHGAVYRSAVLHHATEADARVLALLGVRTVIDLRTHEERSAGGVQEGAWHGVDVAHLPLIVELWSSETMDEPDPVDYLVSRYEEMLVDAQGMLRQALLVVADPANHPVVFHCTAGKDRTGVLAAVILSALGVPDDDIADDYAMSGAAMPALIELLAARSTADDTAEGSTAPIVAALTTAVAQPNGMLGAPREAMVRVLAGIRERHGSTEAYLTSIGVPASVLHSLRLALLLRV